MKMEKKTDYDKSSSVKIKRQHPLDIKKKIITASKIRNTILSNWFYFAHDILKYDKFTSYHKKIINFIETSPYKTRVILSPRHSYKTTAITISYSIWRLLRNPELRILIASSIQRNSKKMLRAIRFHYTWNALLKGLFPDRIWASPDKESPAWKEEELILPRKSADKEASITAVSLETGVTSQHYDIAIIDDIMDETNYRTKESRDLVKEWLRMLQSVLSEETEKIYLGTRWHEDDPYGELLESPYVSQFVSGYTDDDGNNILPNFYTDKFIQAAMRNYRPDEFARFYENKIISSKDAPFKQEYLQYYETLPPGDYTVLAFIDAAFGTEAINAYSAITVWAYAKNRNIYLLEAWRDKVQMTLLGDKVFEVAKVWHPRCTYIEKGSFEKVFMPYLKTRMKESNFFFSMDIVPIGTRKKEDRILGLEPYFRNKIVYIKKQHKVFETELLTFPRGKTLDEIDSAALMVLVGIPFSYDTPQKEVEWYPWGYKNWGELERAHDRKRLAEKSKQAVYRIQ